MPKLGHPDLCPFFLWSQQLKAHCLSMTPDVLAALQERIATATVDEELANDPKLAEEVDREVASKHFMP